MILRLCAQHHTKLVCSKKSWHGSDPPPFLAMPGFRKHLSLKPLPNSGKKQTSAIIKQTMHCIEQTQKQTNIPGTCKHHVKTENGWSHLICDIKERQECFTIFSLESVSQFLDGKLIHLHLLSYSFLHHTSLISPYNQTKSQQCSIFHLILNFDFK